MSIVDAVLVEAMPMTSGTSGEVRARLRTSSMKLYSVPGAPLSGVFSEAELSEMPICLQRAPRRSTP
jgi:hypothetical protein